MIILDTSFNDIHSKLIYLIIIHGNCIDLHNYCTNPDFILAKHGSTVKVSNLVTMIVDHLDQFLYRSNLTHHLSKKSSYTSTTITVFNTITLPVYYASPSLTLQYLHTNMSVSLPVLFTGDIDTQVPYNNPKQPYIYTGTCRQHPFR